jgi:hypothetical protein
MGRPRPTIIKKKRCRVATRPADCARRVPCPLTSDNADGRLVSGNLPQPQSVRDGRRRHSDTVRAPSGRRHQQPAHGRGNEQLYQVMHARLHKVEARQASMRPRERSSAALDVSAAGVAARPHIMPWECETGGDD